MKKIFVLIIIMTFTVGLFAQQKNVQNTKANCEVNLKAYYKFAKSDANNYFYEIDFAKFPSQFEKSYFMNQVYKNSVLVSIDSDLSKSKIQIMANIAHTEQKILENIEDLIYKTVNANNTMTITEKQNWLNSSSKNN
jgi:hypothetical protein